MVQMPIIQVKLFVVFNPFNVYSYVVGGPEVNRSLDTRPRSYGMESVEDDPFIEAHFASMQSMNTAEGKKKKPDNGVNYGYLSQGKCVQLYLPYLPIRYFSFC